MRKPRTPSPSNKLTDRANEQVHAEAAVERPQDAKPSASQRHENSDRPADELVASSAGGKDGNGSQTILPFQNFGWQLGQAGRSLAISASAVIAIMFADLLDPGHMTPWIVYGSVGLYIAGTLAFFYLERSEHRKRRTVLPLDLSGGARSALILAAILFCTSSRPATDGLAGSLALAAIILGSASDGAWIALVAEHRRMGFWRASLEILNKHREAEKRLWSALTGRDEA